MKHICATLLLLCNTFTGDLNKEFIDKVTSCALQYNSILIEADRMPINLVVAQAILESSWGQSRFAREGNNLFGIRAVDDEDYMLSMSLKKVKKYPTFCSSVIDYIDLLTYGEPYKEFQDELVRQWMNDRVDIIKLIDYLDKYAEDKDYKSKLKKIVKQLQSL
tara:strand:- start:751 stop:1239 length:489 start_codon:yes stop_codon:yes gene_type:complete